MALTQKMCPKCVRKAGPDSSHASNGMTDKASEQHFSRSSEGGTRTRDTTIMSRVLNPEASVDGEKPQIIDDDGDNDALQ